MASAPATHLAFALLTRAVEHEEQASIALVVDSKPTGRIA
jgi:hypothetical protein